MAEISFSIPNAQVGRMVDALCIRGGYSGDPEDEPARRDFARGVVREFIRQAVREVEMQQAYEALQAERPNVDSITVE